MVRPLLNYLDESLYLARRELSHDLVGFPSLREEVESRRDRLRQALLGGPFGPLATEGDPVGVGHGRNIPWRRATRIRGAARRRHVAQNAADSADVLAGSEVASIGSRGRPGVCNESIRFTSATEETTMATSAERMRALRERERRGRRRFTIGVTEDDFPHDCGARLRRRPQAPIRISRRKPSASSSPTCSLPVSNLPRVTASNH